jgi:hypothetical protein
VTVAGHFDVGVNAAVVSCCFHGLV